MLDDIGVTVISVVLNRVGFVRGGYLRKNLQAYQTLGREKRKRLYGTDSIIKITSYYYATAKGNLLRLIKKDQR